MTYADHITESIWADRYAWLRQTEEDEAGIWGSIFVSPQGILLAYDTEIAFCAGA